MKIWVISSPPFLRDFENLTSHWPKEIETIITPVTNFSLGPRGIKSFLALEKQITPAIILTDHGHPAFLALRLRKLLGLSQARIFLFLRGNYWLESKGYSTKLNKIKIYGLTIKTAPTNFLLLQGLDGHTYNYVTLKRDEKHKIYTYGSIVPGKYILNITDEEGVNSSFVVNIPLDTKAGKTTSLHTVTTLDALAPFARKKEDIRLWLLKLGWKQLINGAEKIIPVCRYLEEEASQNCSRPTAVCPIGIDEYVDKPKDLRLKHPSAVIIQNHQIAQKSEALLSFVSIIQKLPKITFYVSRGNPENRSNQNYLDVIEAYSNLANVVLVDINSTNREDYLANTDLYILRSGLDCTPATVIEAAMVGKPVLASKIGGVPEMIINGKTGWSIENDNLQEWLDKIKLLTRDKKLAETLGQQGKEHAIKTYSTSVVSKKLLKIISDT